MPTATETSVRDFEGRWIDEGYEFIGVGAETGWRAMAGWGVDGWDLGDWPYVIVLFRELGPRTFQRVIYVEGDITIETYDTAEERETATDDTAMFYWRAQGEDWLDRPEADLRGPYGKQRA